MRPPREEQTVAWAGTRSHRGGDGPHQSTVALDDDCAGGARDPGGALGALRRLMLFPWYAGSSRTSAGSEGPVNVCHEGCEMRGALCEALRTPDLVPRTIG